MTDLSIILQGIRRHARSALWATVLAFMTYFFFIPDPHVHLKISPERKPFTWNRDEYWLSLLEQFRHMRGVGCPHLIQPIHQSLSKAFERLKEMSHQSLQPGDKSFDRLETSMFELAPMIAACPEKLPEYIQFITRTRSLVKKQSRRWDVNSQLARDRIYRMLYGGRAALEEIMLQAPMDSLPALVLGDDEPSQTPSTRMLGVTIHSGDILVSRGGHPTSAVIALGNDYPGYFSHVALVYVDKKTSLASTVEATSKEGFHLNTLEQYLTDIKLRVMVLRLRADLPELLSDPLIPHKAATQVFQLAQTRRIGYDFEMNHKDRSKFYCSEVVSFAYEAYGLRLWMGLSTISAPGLTSWLANLGVKHFVLQEPSDLEYDPQLSVVAEWRDPETLFQDHVENAVTEVMLDGAEAGDRLDYSWYILPAARIAKLYSTILNLFGSSGIIPEGLNATAAAKTYFFMSRHEAMKQAVLLRAKEFKLKTGFTPSHWNLLSLAKIAKENSMN